MCGLLGIRQAGKAVILGLGLLLAGVRGQQAQAEETAQALIPRSPAREIVLLTSLDYRYTRIPHRFPQWMRQNYLNILRDLPGSLGRSVREHYNPRQYTVRLVERANQHDLWQALHSPHTLGVIWLSHAGNHVIADSQGFDVSDAFQYFHPNLRFLAIVGCNGARPMTPLISRYRHPNLSVYAFNRLVGAQIAIPEVLEWSDGVLARQTSVSPAHAVTAAEIASSARSRPKVEITLTRRLPSAQELARGGALATIPAVRVETEDHRVWGVFPAARLSQAGSEQRLVVQVPAALPDQALNLVLNAGDNNELNPSQVFLGSFQASSSEVPGTWRVFAQPDGRPIGETSQLLMQEE